jgi:hypothetical protein
MGKNTMSENASLVRVTSLMAANGAVLLKAFDIIQAAHLPLQRPIFDFAFFVLPPVAGLTAGFLQLGLIELHEFKPWKGSDKWLIKISAIGVGAPLAVWFCGTLGWLGNHG